MTEAGTVNRTSLRPAYAATRAHLGIVACLCALAAISWWWTVGEMRGMDEGPWTALGAFGWFVGVWVVMMAAMMFPSVAPTVALYARMSRSRVLPLAFTLGYLSTWAAAGVAAFLVALATTHAAQGALDWDNAGQTIAGLTLLMAAGYELTPLKDVCLGKCRSPLGALLGSWRAGWRGGLRMGLGNGAWCVGCCWALMASLFALGVMSVTWMAVIAGLIGIEKTIPWRRTASYGTTMILVALGVIMLLAPDALPGLTVPAQSPMPSMSPMGSWSNAHGNASHTPAVAPWRPEGVRLQLPLVGDHQWTISPFGPAEPRIAFKARSRRPASGRHSPRGLRFVHGNDHAASPAPQWRVHGSEL
jgi:predicted metal-binding membrane protein